MPEEHAANVIALLTLGGILGLSTRYIMMVVIVGAALTGKLRKVKIER